MKDKHVRFPDRTPPPGRPPGEGWPGNPPRRPRLGSFEKIILRELYGMRNVASSLQLRDAAVAKSLWLVRWWRYGSFYAVTAGLIDKGLVRMRKRPAADGGLPRTFYLLTKEGSRVARPLWEARP